MRKLDHPGTGLALALVALIAYLPALSWGLPRASGPDRVQVWAYDDISPLSPLTEVHGAFVAAGSDPWLPYPLLHHFVLAGAYAPYLLWLLVTGQFHLAGAEFPYGLADPVGALRVLTVLARLVTIAMAAGVVVIASRIGATLWGETAGLLAGLVTLVPYPMLYYTKTANLEIPALFWTALALLSYCKLVVGGFTARRAASLGAFAGLATATKDQAAGMFVLLPLALLAAPARDPARPSLPWWKASLALLGPGILAYALGSGLAFDPARYLAHLDFVLNRNPVIYAQFVHRYPATPAGAAALTAEMLLTVAWILGPVLTAASALGLLDAARRRRRALALAVPALGYALLTVALVGYFKIRYAMPLVLVLGIFGARGTAVLLAALPRSKLAAGAVLLFAFGWPVVFSADLLFQMANDSRVAAAEWLDAAVPPGGSLAYCGAANNLPRVRADVRLVAIPPEPASARYLEAQHPDLVVIVPDWTSPPGVPHSLRCSDDTYRRLHDRSLGYRLAGAFKTRSLLERQLLDYPSVNPPVHIFTRDRAEEPAGPPERAPEPRSRPGRSPRRRTPADRAG